MLAAGSTIGFLLLSANIGQTKFWAGDYFDINTKASLNLIYKKETLLVGNTVLEPVSNLYFTYPNGVSAYSFEGDSLNTKFVLTTKGMKNRTFEKVKKVTLTGAQLQEYKGEFYSPELDTKYQVTMNDTVLLLKIPRNDEMKFSPFIKDLFSGDYFSILFSSDKTKKISGFFLTTGRVRNPYFEKLGTNSKY